MHKLGEIIYRISAGKVDGCFRIDGTILFVEPHLVLCQLKGDIGDIDTADVGGVTGGIEAKRPDVTEPVENPPPLGEVSDHAAIILLIEEATGLSAVTDIEAATDIDCEGEVVFLCPDLRGLRGVGTPVPSRVL